MTSPCSVPNLLRDLGLVPLETPAEQACCRRHDAKYEVGGPREARLRADLVFGLELLDAGMDADMAERYVWGVRMYGGAHWNGEDGPGALPVRAPEQHEAP